MNFRSGPAKSWFLRKILLLLWC